MREVGGGRDVGSDPPPRPSVGAPGLWKGLSALNFFALQKSHIKTRFCFSSTPIVYPSYQATHSLVSCVIRTGNRTSILRKSLRHPLQAPGAPMSANDAGLVKHGRTQVPNVPLAPAVQRTHARGAELPVGRGLREGGAAGGGQGGLGGGGAGGSRPRGTLGLGTVGGSCGGGENWRREPVGGGKHSTQKRGDDHCIKLSNTASCRQRRLRNGGQQGTDSTQ